MAYDTKTLREAGKAALTAAGMPLELDTSGHGANQLYRVRADAERNAGKLVRLRTNNRWAILDYATGPQASAPIEQLEGVDYVCGVCVNPQGEIEVYFIPAGRVDAHMKAEHKAFMERTEGLGDSKVRILKFRSAPSSYAEFKLRQMPPPAASSPRLSVLRGQFTELMERAQRNVADLFGVPVNAVRISIDFPPHGPELVAPEIAAAQYHERIRIQEMVEEIERDQIEIQRKKLEADRSASAKEEATADCSASAKSEKEELEEAEDYIEQLEADSSARAKEGA